MINIAKTFLHDHLPYVLNPRLDFVTYARNKAAVDDLNLSYGWNEHVAYCKNLKTLGMECMSVKGVIKKEELDHPVNKYDNETFRKQGDSRSTYRNNYFILSPAETAAQAEKCQRNAYEKAWDFTARNKPVADAYLKALSKAVKAPTPLYLEYEAQAREIMVKNWAIFNFSINTFVVNQKWSVGVGQKTPVLQLEMKN